MSHRPEGPSPDRQHETEASVTISEVAYRPEAADLLRAFELEAPEPATTAGYALDFEGHLVLRDATASGIVLKARHGPQWALAFNERRPELWKQYPDTPWAFWNCFRFSIGALRLPRQFEIDIYARRKESDLGPFATIRGSRSALPSLSRPHFQPIMLTTMGRTGATWLTHVLSQHPSVAQLEPFRFEGRVASYWLEAVGALSEPMSFLQTVRATELSAGWWLGQVQSRRPNVDPALEEWLCTTHVAQLLDVLKQRVDAFYEAATRLHGKVNVTRFVEKCWPESYCQAALWEIYPRATEIFLVRDFRDMLASMLAYSVKQRQRLFGQNQARGTEEFISQLRDSVDSMFDAWELRSDVARLVTYEDLVRNPTETVADLLEHAGLDADGSTVEAMLNGARETLVERQESHRTTTSPEDSIGRWQHDLDASVQKACEDEFGAALAAFGYR